ncbi:site-2 protease family protein [archaeon]|jgi:Zn-dependent protease|nr:site-2 protease family protein [archaeon]MBT6824288.1 site-2 protease family protein [archaeon]MBT7107366.1 site-2 protease family protein [archaeon]MBT7297332.1 site-2 protease family protein [archaeon]
MKFSKIEREHLFKAWVAISLAFGIVLSGGISGIFSPNLLTMVIVSALTVGLGFLAHEIAHKYVAQRYHCYAEFRAFDKMLILAIFMSFFGFVFAAPGAVMIRGVINRERNGKISLAGPITNIIIALFFLLLLNLSILPMLSKYGLLINSWLALFNMIPFGNLDGSKILRWDKKIYSITTAVALILLLLSFRILPF